MYNHETQRMTKAAKKPINNILVTIICCAFVAGITLLCVYLFAPGVFGEGKDNEGISIPNVLNQNNDIPNDNSQNSVPFQSDNELAEKTVARSFRGHSH